ncbi:MAG: aminopeptidase P family protein [Spirochaeta sp.]|nr:aminopeptidase P family protein [Spirochaeta sp.]
MQTREKISTLRTTMQQAGLDAYIVFGTDPHQSEYLAPHWQHRAWLSGFKGSAGTVVVTAEEAGLWTDSRYYLEAEEVLTAGPITLHRQDDPEVLSYPEYLCDTLKPGAAVGCDAACLSLSQQRSLTAQLNEVGIRLRPGDDLLGPLWKDRPALPDSPAYALESEYLGATRGEKLSRLRAASPVAPDMEYFVTALDEVAWLLNVRGWDIPYNPLVISYLVVHSSGATWFVDESKLSAQLKNELRLDAVSIAPYGEAREYVAELPESSIVVADPISFSCMMAGAIPPGTRLVEHRNGVASLKAIKTEREIELLRSCMTRDGAALLRFLYAVEEAAPHEELTELSAVALLRKLRAADPRFVEESFATISGYREHGAVVHYSVTAESALTLKADGLYLIDSGGHYLDGTTDITRTISLGRPTEEARRDFTLVLKGHIALARLSFPVGTTGTHIDAIARLPLWREGRNYGHGTGHGIGFFLNVHEGPHRISPTLNSVPLEPGMLISNEPGLYRAGCYGIRTENIVVVQQDTQTEFGEFLSFETLSLCPLDLQLVDTSLLSETEISWIDEYHQHVRESLAPHLSSRENEYLHTKTKALRTIPRSTA